MTVHAAGVLSARERVSPLHLGLLALACLVLYLPGFFTLPPIDRDEPRYAQASKQMVETGDLVDIRFQDEPRYKKPIGIYWLQVAAVKLVGLGPDSPIWVYRLPSLAGAIIAVLLTALIGARLFDRRTGIVAALLLASCLLMAVEARLAKTDAVLLASTLAAQLMLARAWMERDAAGPPSLAVALGFWLALGAGMLVKGPIIVLACGGTALLLSLFARRGRWLLRLRPALGVPLALLVVLPWLVAIGLQSDGAFFQASVGHDLLGKVLSGQESHGAPPGYYAVAVWLTFWPGSLLLFLALPWIWSHRRDPSVMFCLAWILPVWIVFELVFTKLPHYVLPAYPAVALLAARAWADGLPTPVARWAARLRLFVVPIWLLVTLGLAAALLAVRWLLGASPPGSAEIALWLAGPVVGLAAGFFYGSRRGGLFGLALGVLVLALGCFQLAPALERLWPSRAIAALVERSAGDCASLEIATAGYSEPSLVFLLGTKTQLTDAARAAALATRGDPCALALIEKREEPAFRAALPPGGAAHEVGRVAGFNYSKGRFVEITLYRSTP